MRRLVAVALLVGVALAPSGVEARRRVRVDVDLRAAEIVESLRFLADTADVGLVVGDGVSGSVTVRLRHVDPLDALFTVATLKGLEARLEGGVVVVTRGAAR